MWRWLIVCLLLAAGSYYLVAFVSDHYLSRKATSHESRLPSTTTSIIPGSLEPDSRAAERSTGEPVRAEEIGLPGSGEEDDLICQDARILAENKQEVPADREGRLIFLGTEVKDPASVPPGKLYEFEMAFLATPIPRQEFEQVPLDQRVTFDGDETLYRRWQPSDPLAPGKVRVARRRACFRKLELGMHVQRGQLLALINPALAIDDLAIKVARLEASEADYRAALKTRDEAEKRYAAALRSIASAPGSVSEEEKRGARLTWDRYAEEARSKYAAIHVAERETSGAYTALKLHEIRAGIPGVVKVLYKSTGDAVKVDEAILQIQDPDNLKVEGTIEVQHARSLKRGMPVIIEPNVPQQPLAILSGHLSAVNCVAVSKGPQPLIASGDEGSLLLVWSKSERGWEPRWRIDHHAAVRTLACTPAGASANLLLSGTASGVGRIFNLANLKEEPRVLEGQHHGAITCAAFSPDGTLCATGGEDTTIRIWDPASGKLLYEIRGAHRHTVTSLQFAAPVRSPVPLPLRLVSAGRDHQLIVWNLPREGPPARAAEQFDRLTGNVAQLGVRSDGEQVLFDHGKDLHVLSLIDRHILGTLHAQPGAPEFATLALFSPAGDTILTNGAGIGCLQLWRAPGPNRRAAALRQLVWSSANVTCAAFAPDEPFAVTGTQDRQVLVWGLPGKAEIEQELTGTLTYVEQFIDSGAGVQKVTIQAELKRPDWLIPGGTAAIVIPRQKSALQQGRGALGYPFAGKPKKPT